MNTITLTATPVSKPEDLPVLAQLAWDYNKINSGGDIAVYTSGFEIILVNKEGDLSFSGVSFKNEEDFVRWLEDQAYALLDSVPVSFLSNFLPASILSETVVSAIKNSIMNEFAMGR